MSKTTEITVYAADEVVTPTELANSAGVPPQMIYSYIKSGRIEAVNGQLEDKDRVQKLIEVDVAEAWLEEYEERKENRKNKSDEQAAALLEAFEANQDDDAEDTESVEA